MESAAFCPIPATDKNNTVTTPTVFCRRMSCMDLDNAILDNRFIISFPGTAPAQHLRPAPYLAPEVDAFPTLLADHAIPFVSRKLLRRHFHVHPLALEQLFIRHFLI